MESIIYANQQDYYAAINAANHAGESTVFIEFMLSAIKASLIEALETSDVMSDAPMDKTAVRRRKIESFVWHDGFLRVQIL